MPEVNEERAEIINYGLQLIIGEIPKIFIIFIIAYFFGVFRLTLLAFLFVFPYRAVSGGTHLHSHIGCIIATSIFYIGNAYLSGLLIWYPSSLKYIAIIIIWLFSVLMITLYAPADTKDLPILRKKERKTKRILSYIIMSTTLIIGAVVKNSIISNLLIIGTLLQTITITKFMYKLTNNEYGYMEYIKTNKV